MEHEVLLRATGLHRHYGPLHAVRGVDIELARGEVLGVLGPNGAGKTTTMQILTGALAPSAGTVAIGGHDLAREPRRAKRLLGYLPEQAPVYPELTVEEYLEFCARLRGAGRRAPLEEVLERCALGALRRRLLGNLSRGQRQRVGIAQAIIHRPAVVVLDEPSTGLDPNQVREVRLLVRELGREGAVILSTHVLPEVQEVCDRVLVLHEGAVVLDRRLEALDAAPRATRVAFARPPGEEALRALDGVAALEPLGPGRWRLVHGPEGFGEALVEAAVAGGWGLRELTPERRTLEEVFVELTCSSGARRGEGEG